MGTESEVRSLKNRLAEAEENLQLIREYRSWHVLQTDVKPQYVKEERRLVQEIEELQAQLAQIEADMQAKAKVRPLIDNPLRLAELSPQGPVQVLLEKAASAWAQSDREETLRLCDLAEQYTDRTRDRTATALVQLYQVAVQDWSDHPEKAIALAKRVKTRFKLMGDRHNSMVAQLLLACLEQASQNLEQASLEYREALVLCRKLEAEAKGTARSQKALFYRQIVEEIERVLSNVESKVIAGQYIRGNLLHTISSLESGDDLNIATYLTTGELVIGGRK